MGISESFRHWAIVGHLETGTVFMGAAVNAVLNRLIPFFVLST